MKTLSRFASGLFLVSSLQAVPAAPVPDAKENPQDSKPRISDPAIIERGPHHRVWSRTNVTTLPKGRTRTNTSSFVELGSGMHRWDARRAQWIGAEATIEIEGNTAVARKTAHHVTFAGNANTAGAIDLLTPDGKRLRSHVLGVAWFDAASGRSEMIGTLKDSPGELHPPNVVLYPDAFDGLKADLRYTHTLGGFEQDVILRENPPLPDGFSPDTTRIEAWTEFIEAPPSTLTQRGRAAMTDDTIDFGAMRTGAGRAFALGQQDNPKRTAPVSKRWLTVEGGRTFLVEAVRFNTVKRELGKLRAAGQQAALPQPPANARLAVAAPHFGDRPFPSAPKLRAAKPGELFRTAAASPPSPLRGERAGVRGKTALNTQPATLNSSRPGFVLDYTLVSGDFDYTFQCDTTYYVSNTVHFEGTVIFEGGTVIKFATNTAQIILDTPVRWLTDQYRPAIFTAKDDNTVGETISGSTGTPGGHYGGGLRFTQDPSETIQNVRFSHLRTGIAVDLVTLSVRHAQFVRCGKAVSAGSYNTWGITLENILFYDTDLVVDGESGFVASHVTIHQCDAVANAEYSQRSAIFYNSLILGNPGFEQSSPTYNSSYQGSSSGVFQTAGAAAHYLANGSVQRNAGSTVGLSATLLADLKKRTTYPPIVLSNQTISADTSLIPQAQRGTGTPDRGYHYDPLDFVFAGTTVSNITLTIAAGTSVGLCDLGTNGPYGYNYALALRDGAQLTSVGTPSALNHFVRYNMVQEQASGNWVHSGPAISIASPSSSAGGAPLTRWRFTKFTAPAAYTFLFQAPYTGDSTNYFLDCQFHGSTVQAERPDVSFTNCLFNRVSLYLDDEWSGYDSNPRFRNCLFVGGQLQFDHAGSGTWTFLDNLFDGTTIIQDAGPPDIVHHNGYTTNLTKLTSTNATGDVLLALTKLTYDAGPLGHFYLPTIGNATNLFNKGSTYATNVGLYHFTTTTNQVKEAGSIVDMGFHYVAVNSSSFPIDTDGDGWPDYLEDLDGDGVVDAGETSWQSYNSPGGLSGSPGLVVYTPLK